MCDHIRARLAERLVGMSRVKLLTVRGLPIVVIDDTFVIKIPKRLSSRRLSRSYPTQQTLAFMSQGADAQGAFPYLEERTGLVVGYILDELEQAIDQVIVTCPKGTDRNFWHFRIDGAIDQPLAAPAPAVVLPLAGLPESPIEDAAAADEKKAKESGK